MFPPFKWSPHSFPHQQASVTLVAISALAISVVTGYRSMCITAWGYGLGLGGYRYSLKMFALERIRAKRFTKAWGTYQHEHEHEHGHEQARTYSTINARQPPPPPPLPLFVLLHINIKHAGWSTWGRSNEGVQLRTKCNINGISSGKCLHRPVFRTFAGEDNARELRTMCAHSSRTFRFVVTTAWQVRQHFRLAASQHARYWHKLKTHTHTRTRSDGTQRAAFYIGIYSSVNPQREWAVCNIAPFEPRAFACPACLNTDAIPSPPAAPSHGVCMWRVRTPAPHVAGGAS